MAAIRKLPPAGTMPCLAVRQPWAWALCSGIKTIENRTWTTDHRGPLAIQASVAKNSLNELIAGGATISVAEFPLGAIIGVVDLIDVQELNESLEENQSAEGRYCWICENPRLLSQPIPYKGTLHLYDLPAEICDDIATQLAKPVKPSQNDLTRISAAIQQNEYDLAIYRCSVYSEMQNYVAVRRNAARAIELNPESPLAHFMRGIAEACIGEFNMAIESLSRAAKLEPEDPQAHYYLAMTYRELGKNELSDGHWAIANRLDPQVPPLE